MSPDEVLAALRALGPGEHSTRMVWWYVATDEALGGDTARIGTTENALTALWEDRRVERTPRGWRLPAEVQMTMTNREV